MKRFLALVLLPLVCAPAALAARGDYATRSFTERADPGLAVSGSLSEYRVVSRARVIVPEDWSRLRAPSDRLRFLTRGTPSCRYALTVTVRSLLGEPGDASERAAERLPARSASYVLDSGRRGSGAFRVVRRASSDRVRVDGLWTSVLTRRDDIARDGQVAWSEIRVTAASRAGDECHSGTYREALGPQVGDALATARARLFFVRG